MTSDSQGNNNGKHSSPCVRNCCLDDNDICLGCFRSLTEITGWSQTTDAQKKEILERCQKRQRENKRY